ncbi:MAG: aromatic ring-hydroxylating dioxygenase subunit alpha [Kofleriaceae bacterium]
MRPLPPADYFTEATFKLEQAALFDRASAMPRYVGHESMVPNIGDYYVPPDDPGRVLIRSETGIELLSNVCRHRESLMLHGRGNVRRISCPAHKWSYSTAGRLLAAPRYDNPPCLDLPRANLQSWRGLLFEATAGSIGDFADVDVLSQLSLSEYALDKVEVEEFSFNWKMWIDNYLDAYHVDIIHPGLRQFVGMQAVRWRFGDSWSIHAVDVKQPVNKGGSSAYQHWHHEIAKHSKGELPRHGAVWLALLPGLAIEWLPYFAVVWRVIPRSPTHTTAVTEYYFPRDVAASNRDLVEAAYTAYRETNDEDLELIERRWQGLESLFRSGADPVAAPYQQPLEVGLQHFHTVVQSQISQCTSNKGSEKR